jgi:prepilin-type N-terminal cleavage/methylation domain-containing protein
VWSGFANARWIAASGCRRNKIAFHTTWEEEEIDAMTIAPCTAGRHASLASPRGFSLIEVMIVMVIIGILTAMAVPSYERAIEQSRADMAAANLRAVWAAQRLFWIDKHTYATDLVGLRGQGLLDTEISSATNGYTYSITTAGDDAFHATAERVGASRWSGTYTIDETGEITGALESASGPSIVPGFL